MGGSGKTIFGNDDYFKHAWFSGGWADVLNLHNSAFDVSGFSLNRKAQLKQEVVRYADVVQSFVVTMGIILAIIITSVTTTCINRLIYNPEKCYIYLDDNNKVIRKVKIKEDFFINFIFGNNFGVYLSSLFRKKNSLTKEEFIKNTEKNIKSEYSNLLKKEAQSSLSDCISEDDFKYNEDTENNQYSKNSSIHRPKNLKIKFKTGVKERFSPIYNQHTKRKIGIMKEKSHSKPRFSSDLEFLELKKELRQLRNRSNPSLDNSIPNDGHESSDIVHPKEFPFVSVKKDANELGDSLDQPIKEKDISLTEREMNVMDKLHRIVSQMDYKDKPLFQNGVDEKAKSRELFQSVSKPEHNGTNDLKKDSANFTRTQSCNLDQRTSFTQFCNNLQTELNDVGHTDRYNQVSNTKHELSNSNKLTTSQILESGRSLVGKGTEDIFEDDFIESTPKNYHPVQPLSLHASVELSKSSLPQHLLVNIDRVQPELSTTNQLFKNEFVSTRQANLISPITVARNTSGNISEDHRRLQKVSSSQVDRDREQFKQFQRTSNQHPQSHQQLLHADTRIHDSQQNAIFHQSMSNHIDGRMAGRNDSFDVSPIRNTKSHDATQSQNFAPTIFKTLLSESCYPNTSSTIKQANTAPLPKHYEASTCSSTEHQPHEPTPYGDAGVCEAYEDFTRRPLLKASRRLVKQPVDARAVKRTAQDPLENILRNSDLSTSLGNHGRNDIMYSAYMKHIESNRNNSNSSTLSSFDDIGTNQYDCSSNTCNTSTEKKIDEVCDIVYEYTTNKLIKGNGFQSKNETYELNVKNDSNKNESSNNNNNNNNHHNEYIDDLETNEQTSKQQDKNDCQSEIQSNYEGYDTNKTPICSDHFGDKKTTKVSPVISSEIDGNNMKTTIADLTPMLDNFEIRNSLDLDSEDDGIAQERDFDILRFTREECDTTKDNSDGNLQLNINTNNSNASTSCIPEVPNYSTSSDHMDSVYHTHESTTFQRGNTLKTLHPLGSQLGPESSKRIPYCQESKYSESLSSDIETSQSCMVKEESNLSSSSTSSSSNIYESLPTVSQLQDKRNNKYITDSNESSCNYMDESERSMTDNQRIITKYADEFGKMCKAESNIVNSICASIKKGEFTESDEQLQFENMENRLEAIKESFQVINKHCSRVKERSVRRKNQLRSSNKKDMSKLDYDDVSLESYKEVLKEKNEEFQTLLDNIKMKINEVQ